MLDAMIASALRKLYQHAVQPSEKGVSKSKELKIATDSFEGRQIAFMNDEYFRATGA